MERDHSHRKAVCKEQNMFPAKAAATFLISPLRSPDAKASKVPATVQSIQPAPHPHCRNRDKTGVLTFHSVKLAFSNTEHPLLQCLLSLSLLSPERNPVISRYSSCDALSSRIPSRSLRSSLPAAFSPPPCNAGPFSPLLALLLLSLKMS